MKLKLDENLGHRWADELRAAGHDVETVHNERLSGATDPAVLDVAVAEGRVFVTLDLDFANPFRFPPDKTAGIAVLRVRDRPGRRDLDAVIKRLIAAIGEIDVAGRLWIVEPDRVRQYESEAN